jgi:ADP-ribosylglycohydrolase
MSDKVRGRYSGCLLGGAVGDALGWPIEFDDIDEITTEYGAAGIENMVPGVPRQPSLTGIHQVIIRLGFWRR